jgi:hypothetical protein
MGRPRKKGRRLPTLKEVSRNPGTKWEKVLVNWYGAEREIEITSGNCVWFHIGKEAVPIRWVIARDPAGEFETQAVLCTRAVAVWIYGINGRYLKDATNIK